MDQAIQPDAPLMQVEDLAVTFYSPNGTFRAVRNASLEIARGEVLGLVGESGCGKSTVAFAMMGYLPGTAQVDGAVRFEGVDITSLSSSELMELRGNRISIVYQDPVTSLNPSMRVGPQVEEVLTQHLDLDADDALARSVELFDSVGLADPDRIGRRYPHQLSGGQQQRVVIAMALACDPHLLIMDEPTTGLDVTTEATILDLIVELKDRVNAGILFVSHNLGVIARVADRVAVMYAGEIVEQAPVREIFKNPSHPYTAGLLSCVPQPPGDDGVERQLSSIPGTVFDAQTEQSAECLFAPRCPLAQESCTSQSPPLVDTGDGHLSRCFFHGDVRSDIWGEALARVEKPQEQVESPVLNVSGLRKFYGGGRRKYILFGPPVAKPVRALVDVDMKVGSGRTIGIVGESGSGKSTAARAIVGLEPKDRGALELHGNELESDVHDRTEDQRAAMRMVFQNPTASLNPKLPVGHTIVRALRKFAGLNRQESNERAEELMEAVGLDPTFSTANPPSSAAVSNSEWRLQALSPPTPTSWSRTKPSPPWTFQSKHRYSTSSRTTNGRRATPTCSLPMISESCATSRTTSCAVRGSRGRVWAIEGRTERTVASVHRGAAVRRAGAGPGRRADSYQARRLSSDTSWSLHRLLLRGKMPQEARGDLRHNTATQTKRTRRGQSLHQLPHPHIGTGVPTGSGFRGAVARKIERASTSETLHG